MTLQEAIRERRSVRTFRRGADLDPATLETLRRLCREAPHPFAGEERPWRIALVVREAGARNRLGTYGVISGATVYFGLFVRRDAGARGEMAGAYALEHVVLGAQTLGLGTCWLGGTFNASQFSSAFADTADAPAGDGWELKIVCPVGVPAAKRSMVDNLFRNKAHSDNRLDFNLLFFDHDFQTPYAAEGAPLSAAFEAVRLAPSACNRQPWRMIYVGPGWVHLFGASDPGFLNIDTGIAMAHFDIGLGRTGSLWHVEPSFPLTPPAGLDYMVSTAV